MTMRQSNRWGEALCAVMLAALGTYSCASDTADVGDMPETASNTTSNNDSGGSDGNESSDSTGPSSSTTGSGSGGSGGDGDTNSTNNTTGFDGLLNCDGFASELDSRWIVFDSDAGKLERRIYAVEMNGSDAPRPLTPADVLAREPALSPDGTELAYVADERIRVLNLSSGEDRDIVAGTEPAWSPDGSSLAYHADRGVSLFDLEDGSSEEIIACTECFYGYENPEFSPSGDALVMDRDNEIDLVDLDTGNSRYVVQNWTTTIIQPTISPDADWVVAAIWCEDPISLWLHEASTNTNPCEGRRLTPMGTAAANPAWGPETVIAYELGEAPRDIALLDVDANTGCVIEHEGDDRNPSWAPEGFEPPDSD